MIITSMPSSQIVRENQNVVNTRETTSQEVLHGLDTSFERNDQGVPLSERQIKGLLYHQWILFNFRLCLTVVYRTVLWIHNFIQFFKSRNNITAETIKQLNSQGGIISKLLQAIGSSDVLIYNFLGIHSTDPNYPEVKRELCRAMHDNQQMSLSKFKEILDENNLQYNQDQLNEEYYRSDECNLGVGTVGQVAKVPMQNGTSIVVKVVNSDVERRFLADISILGTILSILTRLTNYVGSGSKEAMMSFINTIPREFDLRYEKSYTAIQRARFDAIDEDPYNITEAEDCRCDAVAHGEGADECRRYLAIRPNRPEHQFDLGLYRHVTQLTQVELRSLLENPQVRQILMCFLDVNVPIEYKTPEIDATLSSRNMMVMEEIHGETLSCSNEKLLSNVIEPLVRPLLRARGISDEEPIPAAWIDGFRAEVRRHAFRAWEHGFFASGECSGDIHNGNIMVSVVEGRLVIHLIDFGNYILESRNTVNSVYTVIAAIESATLRAHTVHAHANAILDAMRQFGIRTREDIDWDSLRNGIIREIQNPENDRSIEKISLKIFDVGFNHGLSVPSSISKLFRARLVL